MGGGAVVDAATAAVAVASAAATVTSNGVFPAASARGVEGAPVSAAVAATTVTGSGVFPAASARGAEGAPASAAVAAATVTGSAVFTAASARGAASVVATATAAAAAAAAIPPDGVRETVAVRVGVFPTPPVDWTTARHDQSPETATTQRRRYQVTPAVTRSGSRRTGMSGAFALLEADEKIVRSLATGLEADGDPELPAALACNLETPGTHARIWGAAERTEFAGLTVVGTSNWRG